MAIEHDTITDPEIHEPKGASTAAIRTVYSSDGAGSGSWIPPIVAGTDVATVGQRYIADGAGGAAWRDGTNIHGEMFITGNVTPIAITAAVDGTLATDTDYTKVSVAWQAGHLSGVTFSVDELIVPVSGDYELSLWASFEVALTSTLVGVRFAVNGVLSTRKVLNKAKTTTDINNISGLGLLPGLTAGDAVSIYIAADSTTNITGREAGAVLKLMSEL